MQSKNNKNIDQLFKDRLQGMETPPPPVVWENIQVALGHKKRDRKVIPLWWKLGGVAAALLVLFAVANMFISDSPDGFIENDTQLVIEDDINSSQEIKEHQTTEDTSQENTIKDVDSNPQEFRETSVASENKTDGIDKVLKSTTPISKKPLANYNNRYKNTSVAATESKTDDLINKNNSITDQVSEKLIAKNTVASTNIKTNEKSSVDTNTQKSSLIKEGDVNAIESIPGPIKEAIANEEVKETEEGLKKESIFDAIEEQKEAVAKNTDEMPADRWSISPNVAPVYYSSLSQGSSIDPSFADNTQNGEVNVSYGINVSYALSPRLTVRSGVSNVNLSYATGGLELATGDASAALQSVRYNGSGIVVTAVDQGALNNAQGGAPFEDLTRKATNGDVFLTQSLSYTEIPTELTYALVNNKIGVHLIGGFSTLLLGNNEVSVSANDFEDVLGEANNLSDVSFSTNVGLGLSYQLSRKFKFNVEPMFKYQLNPYTDTSVQFKPYYVGVYSGLSFKF